MGLGFETVQILLHGGVVDAQELVGRGHYVDTIRLALGTFPVHELVHRLMGGRTPEDGAHHQEQRPAQGGGTPFGYTAAADFHLAGLVRRSVNARKGHQSLLRVEVAHIADLRHELGAEGGPNAEHPHHNRALRQRRRQRLHFVSEHSQGGGSGPELGYRLIYQELGGSGLRHDAEMPTGGGVDVQRLVLAEVVAVLPAPTQVFACESPFGFLADAAAMPEFSHKIHPLFTPIPTDRA